MNRDAQKYREQNLVVAAFTIWIALIVIVAFMGGGTWAGIAFAAVGAVGAGVYIGLKRRRTKK